MEPTGWRASLSRARAVGQQSAHQARALRLALRRAGEHPRLQRWRTQVRAWPHSTRMGLVITLGGTLLATLILFALDAVFGPMPSPGVLYVPLVAMLAYHWGWRHALLAVVLQIACVYVLFLPPQGVLKPLAPLAIVQLVTLAAVTGFVLSLVRLARARRALAEREAARSSALNRIGMALASELDETALLDRIAKTACHLTGAGFAAFTLRPVNDQGEPIGPSEGSRFHLAAVTGVTAAQEDLFRRMPLGGEGFLAPIFRHGVPVRVADALQAFPAGTAHGGHPPLAPKATRGAAHLERRDDARRVASEFAHGMAGREDLRGVGLPRGHPMVRSFLGAPLLDRAGRVRGGLLLGHTLPDRFSVEDELLLQGLAAQAAVALENARLYRLARVHAHELDVLFESIEDGVLLLDEHGLVRRENRTARALRTAAPQAVDAATEDAADEALSTLQVAGRDGEAREYLVHRSSLRPPEDAADEAAVGGTVVVWHDVTEARRLLVEQRAHAEAEARRTLLQRILDELPSAVFLVRGLDARMVLANGATAAVWGAPWPADLPMVEFLSSRGIRIATVDGAPMPCEDFATLRALRTGAAVRHHQEVIRRADGTDLPVLLNAVALDGALLEGPAGRGEPVALVAIHDITPLKEAERIKDEFISIAAHELRNPMAAVQGFAQMLSLQTARGKGPELAPWQVEAVEAIDASIARLSDLTEDLLDVTRLQAGRLVLQQEPVDLVALLRRVLDRVRVISPAHALEFAEHPEHVVAEVDQQRIEQVLTNLLLNAVKYSPQGGPVVVTLRDDGSEACLSIRDTGIGIPQEQQAHIFGRFVRGQNAQAAGIPGTGLGLFLSRALVERHGGRIWFDSTEGEGTTFWVALPLHAVAFAEAAPTEPA